MNDQLLSGSSKLDLGTIFILRFWLIIGIPRSYSRPPGLDSFGTSTEIFRRALGERPMHTKAMVPKFEHASESPGGC